MPLWIKIQNIILDTKPPTSPPTMGKIIMQTHYSIAKKKLIVSK